ncbi:MAG: N-6 DNA methylase [Melioribacteraceae bacterium]
MADIIRHNERVWTGHVISWIQEAVREGRTKFQEATNDSGLILESGKTKFPDILLFSNKTSGVIFNGWELKFPDTPIDDLELLSNAVEKAERIKANSFVTWNGAEAVIWKIESDDYDVASIIRIKTYPKVTSINSRNDLSVPSNYRLHEEELKNRLNEILHDLEQFQEIGEIRQAINISGNIINAIKEASQIIIPQFQEEITLLKGSDSTFRNEFNYWKILERSTLHILASSSRRSETVVAEGVLAKFTFYNLVGKILFYLTLSENLPGHLDRISMENQEDLKTKLEYYFENAKRIDYQAVFQPYFTDNINYTHIVNETIFSLLKLITEFDFTILPTDVIGEILENLVPKDEKQKFGQYFTSNILSNLISFPAIQTTEDYIFDPTSGTGTFLNSFYEILNYHGNRNHSQLLNQIWGNDISHFPAILSVINLYKQNVTEVDNFPRIMRKDFFTITSGETVFFPDSSDYTTQIQESIPAFDAIVSNFPFIQQEDIPNEVLTTYFREQFETAQQAFLNDESFKINERSDYFTYCVYNSIKFLKEDGFLSVITSNAWLGKEYGIQFKKFLLDNFHIKYIVKSSIEHWFTDSKVSTIYLVLQKKHSEETTKFVTINSKLDELFDIESNNKLSQIESFYTELDHCSDPLNSEWRNNTNFQNRFEKLDNSVNVSIIEKSELLNSLSCKTNWSNYFISTNIFSAFSEHLTDLFPTLVTSFRGERTGWNPMFIIPRNKIEESGIENNFLVPYVKKPSELTSLVFNDEFDFYLFVCDLPIEQLQDDYPGAYNWIISFTTTMNKNGSKTIPESCSGHKPFWYSLNPKTAHIITAINPFKRLFFTYSSNAFAVDQRLVALEVHDANNIQLISALLNSVVSLLSIELMGTSRNLGALDLNANYFKTLKILNPQNLTSIQTEQILTAFEPLANREISDVFDEVTTQDRIIFDKTILQIFEIDDTILDSLYELLITLVRERISLRDN